MTENRSDRSRQAEIVRRTVREKLTPRQRQAVLLYYGKRMKMTDIAREMGVNVSTVSRTVKRGREHIHRDLASV